MTGNTWPRRFALPVTFGLALALTGATVVRADSHLCGEADERYVCGEIIVGLFDDADATIEEVVARNGGDPATDIDNRIESIRAYTILVGEGNESPAIERYSADPAVEYAHLNGAGGDVAPENMPDTAVSTDHTGSGVLLVWILVTALALFTPIATAVKEWSPLGVKPGILRQLCQGPSGSLASSLRPFTSMRGLVLLTVIVLAGCALPGAGTSSYPTARPPTSTPSATPSTTPTATATPAPSRQAASPASTCEPDASYVCGEIIVGLVDQAPAIEVIVDRNGGTREDIVSRMDSIRAYVIKVPPGSETEQVARYREDPAVEYADVNGTSGGVPSPTP